LQGNHYIYVHIHTKNDLRAIVENTYKYMDLATRRVLKRTEIDALKLCTPLTQPIYHESSHVHTMQKNKNAHYSQKSFQNKETSQITRSGHLSRYKTTKALFPKGISFPFVPVQPRRVCHSSLVPFHTMCSVASCEEPYGQYPVSLFSS
jgi:hypothetical protein